MALGNQIKHYREKMGWTLEKLEELSGVEKGTISALERRDSRRSEYGDALARAFGLTFEQLTDTRRDYAITTSASTSVHAVASDRAVYNANPWPFTTARQMFDALPEREKARVDGYIAATVQAWIVRDEARQVTT